MHLVNLSISRYQRDQSSTNLLRVSLHRIALLSVSQHVERCCSLRSKTPNMSNIFLANTSKDPQAVLASTEKPKGCILDSVDLPSCGEASICDISCAGLGISLPDQTTRCTIWQSRIRTVKYFIIAISRIGYHNRLVSVSFLCQP